MPALPITLPGLVPATCGIIGNAVQIRSVPNAVRWTGLQGPLAQAGKVQFRVKPSQKTGQTKPGRRMVSLRPVSLLGDLT